MLFSDIATFTVVRMEMIIGMLMFSASQQCVHFAVYKVAVYCCWLSQPGCKPRPQDMAFDILEGIKFLKVPRAGDNIHMRIGVHSGPDQIRSTTCNQACRRIQRSQAEEADEEAEEDVKDVDSPDGGERQPTTMRRRTEEVWCMRCYLEI